MFRMNVVVVVSTVAKVEADAASSVLLAVATLVSGWLDGWVIDILLPRFCSEWAEDVQIEI